MTDDEQILIGAVRYALGRMSYYVVFVCQYIAYKHKNLSRECKNIIIRDIEEEIAMYHRLDTTCGMECDEREWIKLLDLLKEGDTDD